MLYYLTLYYSRACSGNALESITRFHLGTIRETRVCGIVKR